MRSPVEVELVTDGSVIHVMQRVLPITTLLLRGLYVPSTLTATCAITNPRLMTLQISYDFLPDVISEFLT